MKQEDWILKYDKLVSAEDSRAQEALMTLGNGYLRWAGTPVWSKMSQAHCPSCFVAGLFEAVGQNAGIQSAHKTLLNLPNPQLIQFYINGRFVTLADEKIVARESWLDFQHGTQHDAYTFSLPEGQFSLTTTKYVDPIEQHNFGFAATVEADFDAQLRIESLIDGTGMAQQDAFHVTDISQNVLIAETDKTDIGIAFAVQTSLGKEKFVSQVNANPELLLEVAQTELKAGQALPFSKVISLATSREIEMPLEFVCAADTTLATIKQHNEDYWRKVWRTEMAGEKLDRLRQLAVFRQHQALHYGTK